MSLAEGLLLAAAAYIAVRTLVGLMRQRRDRLVGEVQEQIDAHQERERERKLRQRKERARDAA